MPEANALVAKFDQAIAELRALVERLDDRQWALRGVNSPGPRFFPEDEDRPVGVIAYHVAAWLPRHAERMRLRAAGAEAPPIDANALNAEEAAEHRSVTPSEVLARLSEEAPGARSLIAGLTDDDLARSWETPAGRMDVRTGIEMVLIGHIDMHRASIEATIKESRADG